MVNTVGGIAVVKISTKPGRQITDPCYNCGMASTYKEFKTVAFTYGIPGQILDVVEPWIQQHGPFGKDVHKSSDLGYGELRDITTLDQALKHLVEIINESSMYETAAKSKRARNKFIADAGGRVGKGFYRYALKAFYLFQA